MIDDRGAAFQDHHIYPSWYGYLSTNLYYVILYRIIIDHCALQWNNVIKKDVFNTWILILYCVVNYPYYMKQSQSTLKMDGLYCIEYDTATTRTRMRTTPTTTGYEYSASRPALATGKRKKCTYLHASTLEQRPCVREQLVPCALLSRFAASCWLHLTFSSRIAWEWGTRLSDLSL